MNNSTFKLRYFRDLLLAGGVIAYPTESVYGLGCLPQDYAAVERILAIKQRPQEKGLILLVHEPQTALPYIQPDCADIFNQLTPLPHPVTWLVPSHPRVPEWLRGTHSSIAIRLTQHPVCRQLCEATGSALVSTSANPSGHPPAHSSLQLYRYFPGQLDAIYHAGVCKQAVSEIRDLVTGNIIRPWTA